MYYFSEVKVISGAVFIFENKIKATPIDLELSNLLYIKNWNFTTFNKSTTPFMVIF